MTSFGARPDPGAPAPGGILPTATTAIVVAAGAGVRMGAPVPKALMPLAGRPMLAWSVDALRACPAIDAIVVLAPPGLEDEAFHISVKMFFNDGDKFRFLVLVYFHY